LYYFRHDLLALVRAWMMSVREWRLRSDPQRMLAWLILVGTVPAAVLGFWFENFFSALFSSPPWVATFLLCTGILLLVTEHLGRRTDSLDKLRWPGALLVGMAQAIALAPGISRSGATIGAGMLAGLTREAATRFSFLLAIPIIFGAGLLQMLHLVQNGIAGKSLEIGVGFVAAAFTGYFCIHALLRYVRHNSLRLFAIYCWVVGLLGLGISVWR
jgi:undecaprenyl-diphosphatase